MKWSPRLSLSMAVSNTWTSMTNLLVIQAMIAAGKAGDE
jgi:hypothetical protein